MVNTVRLAARPGVRLGAYVWWRGSDMPTDAGLPVGVLPRAVFARLGPGMAKVPAGSGWRWYRTSGEAEADLALALDGMAAAT